MMSRYVNTLLVSLIFFGLATLAYGQDAQIQGQVADPSGAAIPKALVHVIDQRTGTERKTETSPAGQYTVPGLTPGLYKVFAEAPGFSTAASDQVTLIAAQSAVLDFVLKVGGSSADVIVTAEKREERLQDVPSSVSVLNTDQLAANNLNTLQDYFDQVPGFIATPNSFDRSALSIRGISPIGGDPTVGIVIDDVPFGLSGSQQSGFVPNIDPGDLVRVEVLRGPQGALYGADSMGGLVKYVTRDPEFGAVSGRIEMGAGGVYNGSNPAYNVRAALNVPVNDVFAVRGSAFVRQDPGYIDNPVLHINGINEIENYGGRLATLWKPSDDFSLRLNGLYQDSKKHGLNEVDVPTPEYPQTLGLGNLQQNYLPGTGQDDLAIQNYSAITKARLGRFDFTSLTGYNITRVPWSVDIGFDSLAGVLTAFPDQGVVGAGYFEIDNEQKVSEEARVSGPLGKWADLVAGGFFTHENSNGSYQITGQNANGQTVGVYATFAQPVSALDEYAGFADLTLHLTERLDVQLGGRESLFHQTLGQTVSTTVGQPTVIGAPITRDQNTFNYLVNPKFTVSPNLMIYARFASGYRPGSPNVLLPDAPRQSDPDSTKSYEGGVKADLYNHNVTVDGAFYYINWDNIQLQLTDLVTNFKYTGNAGGAKSQGVELSVTAHPLQGLTLDGTFSYDDAVLTKGFPDNSQYYGVQGNRLPLTTDFSGSFSAEQVFRLGSAMGFVGGSVAYVGDRKGVFIATPDRQDLPAYTKLNLHAGVSRGTWTTNAYLNNATDTRGLLDGGPGYFFPPARVYITPLTAGLNISKRF
jgi:iron complex outermembrane recepter protein